MGITKYYEMRNNVYLTLETSILPGENLKEAPNIYLVWPQQETDVLGLQADSALKANEIICDLQRSPCCMMLMYRLNVFSFKFIDGVTVTRERRSLC